MRCGHADKRGHCLICAAPALMKRAEVNSQVLQDVLKRVDRAFDGFLLRVKQGWQRVIRASDRACATITLCASA